MGKVGASASKGKVHWHRGPLNLQPSFRARLRPAWEEPVRKGLSAAPWWARIVEAGKESYPSALIHPCLMIPAPAEAIGLNFTLHFMRAETTQCSLSRGRCSSFGEKWTLGPARLCLLRAFQKSLVLVLFLILTAFN